MQNSIFFKGVRFFAVVLGLFWGAVLIAAQVDITSNPSESEVYIVNPSTRESTMIGETPYNDDIGSSLRSLGLDSSYIIEIRRVGFKPYRLLVSNINRTKLEIDASLEVDSDIERLNDYDLLIGQILHVVRYIRTQDFDSALLELENLEKRFPQFSVIYELRGSIFYLNREFRRALSMYRKAFSLNPLNRDAFRMKDYLERRFNLEDNTAQFVGQEGGN